MTLEQYASSKEAIEAQIKTLEEKIDALKAQLEKEGNECCDAQLERFKRRPKTYIILD